VVPPELAPIVAVPAALQFAKPATLGALAIVATGADDELQWLFSVMSCVPHHLVREGQPSLLGAEEPTRLSNQSSGLSLIDRSVRAIR